MSENWKADFQKQLDDLLTEMKRFDLELQATWIDEYGGSQSVTIGNMDRLTVVSKIQKALKASKTRRTAMSDLVDISPPRPLLERITNHRD